MTPPSVILGTPTLVNADGAFGFSYNLAMVYDLANSRIIAGRFKWVNPSIETYTESPNNHIYKSDDQGVTWSQIFDGSDFTVGTFSPWGFGILGVNLYAWGYRSKGMDPAGGATCRSGDMGATWTELEYHTTGVWGSRSNFGTCVFDNKLWIIGGFDGTNYLSDTWSSADGITWLQTGAAAGWGTTPFTGRGGMGVAVIGGKMVIVGGTDGTNLASDVWSSADGVTWTKIADTATLPIRTNPAVTAITGAIVMYGGYDVITIDVDHPSLEGKDDLWVSLDEGVTWASFSDAITGSGRATRGILAVGDTIFIAGGKSDAN